MHLKYTEDIVVFANKRPTYNPQMQKRLSRRIAQAQKGNSMQWRTATNDSKDVFFTTSYKPRSWNIYNADLKYPSNVIEIPSVVSNSKEKCNHPTQKPVPLLEYLIKTYTNEGETVLDNTMGSGSTGVACVKEKRNFIGIELNEEYFKIAKQRIENEESQPTLF
jgi:site-specific DNA-methyltransferase (adenine-specific)